MGKIVVTISNPKVSSKQLAKVVKSLDIAEQAMLAYDVEARKTTITIVEL